MLANNNFRLYSEHVFIDLYGEDKMNSNKVKQKGWLWNSDSVLLTKGSKNKGVRVLTHVEDPITSRTVIYQNPLTGSLEVHDEHELLERFLKNRK